MTHNNITEINSNKANTVRDRERLIESYSAGPKRGHGAAMNNSPYLSVQQSNHINNMSSSYSGKSLPPVSEIMTGIRTNPSVMTTSVVASTSTNTGGGNQDNQSQQKAGVKRQTPSGGKIFPNPKSRRLHVVKPSFDVAYADLLLKLDGATYLLYGVNGEGRPIIRVQDCAYNSNSAAFKKTGHDNFVPRTVRFSPQQWKDLLAMAEEVTQALEDDENARVHIGENTFVTVKPDRCMIDIREYFLPEDSPAQLDVPPEDFFDHVVPTRRGVQISEDGWRWLVSKGEKLIKEFAGNKIDWEADCFTSHTEEVDLMSCSHCNPNGYSFWRKGVNNHH
jgi:hypothetical protein